MVCNKDCKVDRYSVYPWQPSEQSWLQLPWDGRNSLYSPTTQSICK